MTKLSKLVSQMRTKYLGYFLHRRCQVLYRRAALQKKTWSRYFCTGFATPSQMRMYTSHWRGLAFFNATTVLAFLLENLSSDKFRSTTTTTTTSPRNWGELRNAASAAERSPLVCTTNRLAVEPFLLSLVRGFDVVVRSFVRSVSRLAVSRRIERKIVSLFVLHIRSSTIQPTYAL